MKKPFLECPQAWTQSARYMSDATKYSCSISKPAQKNRSALYLVLLVGLVGLLLSLT
jgi:hypothetical protein